MELTNGRGQGLKGKTLMKDKNDKIAKLLKEIVFNFLVYSL